MREVCVRGHGVWYWPHTTSCYGPGVGRSDQITIRGVMGVWYMFGIDEGISPNSAILSFSLYLVIYAFAIQLLAVNLNLLKHFLNWIWQPVLTLVLKRSCPSLNRMSQNRLIFLSIHTSKVTYHCEHFLKWKSTSFFMKFQNISPKNIKKNCAGRKRNTDINGFEVVWPHVFNWNLTPVLCTGQKWYQCILFQLKLKFLKHVFIFLKNATF